MKTLRTRLILGGLILLLAPAVINAETIYKQDGAVIKGKISSQAEGTLWYEVATGTDIVEEVSIEVLEVTKILNDDGSVSPYSPTYTPPPGKK